MLKPWQTTSSPPVEIIDSLTRGPTCRARNVHELRVRESLGDLVVGKDEQRLETRDRASFRRNEIEQYASILQSVFDPLKIN